MNKLEEELLKLTYEKFYLIYSKYNKFLFFVIFENDKRFTIINFDNINGAISFSFGLSNFSDLNKKQYFKDFVKNSIISESLYYNIEGLYHTNYVNLINFCIYHEEYFAQLSKECREENE